MPQHALRDAEREAAARAHEDEAAQAARDIRAAGGEDVPLLPQEPGGGVGEPEPGEVVVRPHGLDEGGGEAAEEGGDPAVGDLERAAALGDRRYGGGRRGEEARQGDQRAKVAGVGEHGDGVERRVLLPPHLDVHVRHGLEVDGEGREGPERPRFRQGAAWCGVLRGSGRDDPSGGGQRGTPERGAGGAQTQAIVEKLQKG